MAALGSLIAADVNAVAEGLLQQMRDAALGLTQPAPPAGAAAPPALPGGGPLASPGRGDTVADHPRRASPTPDSSAAEDSGRASGAVSSTQSGMRARGGGVRSAAAVDTTGGSVLQFIGDEEEGGAEAEPQAVAPPVASPLAATPLMAALGSSAGPNFPSALSFVGRGGDGAASVALPPLNAVRGRVLAMRAVLTDSSMWGLFSRVNGPQKAGGGHAHGAAAGGHGHGTSAGSQHGHSHGGKPCHGHGQPGAGTGSTQDVAQHGHSHGGKPCHGH